LQNFHPDDLLIRQQAFEESYNGNILRKVTPYLMTEAYRWAEVGKKYFDEDGNPDEMVGVLLRAV
jgi:hypothetical protein